ncbi:TPM domain-containing protein [Bdellovibrio bacteriovorus]|uniref:TPM domain-containing protein n=1 Tax=Bdellovibrio bacteriovorus TaxID=959 RepID=UPI0035A5F4E7
MESKKVESSMAWIHRYLSSSELIEIEAAIQKAEEHTNGEIVPVIVRRSSAVGHVPLSLTLLITLFIVILEIPYSDWLWVKPWVWAWPFLIVAIYYGSTLLAQSKFIQKIFVPEKDEVDQVHRRAQLEFYLNRINRTKGGMGILIFVSVMEKKAVILADEGIAKKLPSNTWDDILAEMRAHFHDGKWSHGYQKAIERCGELLKQHFPISGNLENELTNHLIIKD